MKALAAIAVLLAVGLVAVSAADAKRSPRLEKLALNAADTVKAKKAIVHSSDLVSGWKLGSSRSDNSPPDCAWQNFSAYTITGQSEADYSQGVSSIISTVQVFKDPADALGDFHADTKTGVTSCEGAVFAHSFGKTAKLLSAKAVSAPKVGDRAAAFQFVVRLGVITFYANVIEFVRDRSIGGLITINAMEPLGGREILAQLMDERLQPGTVA